MTDLNIEKAAVFGAKAAETLKEGINSIEKFITESAEKTIAEKAAKLGGQIRENGLQETAEEIIDDIKDFAEELPTPLNAKKNVIEKIVEFGHTAGEKLEDGPFGAAKFGYEAGNKIGEAIKDKFSNK